MSLCRDCAHWRGDWRLRDEMGDVLPVNYDDPDEYEKSSEPSEYRVCLGIPFMFDKRALHSAAAVMDGSGYTGKLVCRGDFGCVFFVKAEAT